MTAPGESSRGHGKQNIEVEEGKQECESSQSPRITFACSDMGPFASELCGS